MGISKRETNIDLLRIISMLMIVTMHALGKSIILDSVHPFSINYYLTYILEAISYSGVNLFIFITGYYSLGSKVRAKKIINIFLETLFYSTIIYFILCLSGNIDFNPKDLVYVFFPVVTRHYWYVTIFVLAYLLLPYLNYFDKIEQSLYKRLLILLFIFFSVIPTFVFFVDSFDLNNGYSLLWFLFLILIAKYFRRFPVNCSGKNRKKIVLVYLGSIILLPLSRFAIAFFTSYINGSIVGSGFFYRYNSILVFASSLSLFLLFTTLTVKNVIITKIVKLASPYILSVYLIHTHKFLKDSFWNPFHFDLIIHSVFLIFFVIASVILVFCLSIIIDRIRAYLFEVIFNTKYMKFVFSKLDNLFNKSVE